MEGKEVYGRSFYGIWGKGKVALRFAGVEFWSGDLMSIGTRVAGGFGHGGQDIHMISWS